MMMMGASSGGGGGVGVGGVVGAPAGFLARISSLEREVSFLKQKVEDDARWKFILQTWVLDNFAFDIQGALLHGHRRQYDTTSSATTATTPNSSRSYGAGLSAAKRKGSAAAAAGASSTYRSKVKIERTEPMTTRYRGGGGRSYAEEDPDELSPTGFMDEDDDDTESEQVHCFGGVMEDGMEVNVHPKDLIITPDICADPVEEEDPGNRGGGGVVSESNQNKRSRKSSETDDDLLGRVGGPSSDNESSASSPSEEEQHRRPHRKMEWALIGTYPNVEAMKQQFNLREWGLSTKQVTGTGAKIYYYCKECRKHGPGRLLIRYKSEDSEVEVLKNQLEHDHSTKKRLTEEMKVEIVNLYKAGMTDSPKILAALKVSKPHMRQPTVKQVCHILKPFRRVEKKQKMKDKKKAAKDKEKQKMSSSCVDLTTGEKKPPKRSKKDAKNESDIGNISGVSSILPQFTLSSGSSQPSSANLTQQQQHLSQFMSPAAEGSRDFQRPHIVSSASGFLTPSQQLQQYYQQQQQQQHSPFDPPNNSHLGQHYP